MCLRMRDVQMYFVYLKFPQRYGTDNSPNYGLHLRDTSALLCPSVITLTKTHKSEKHTQDPCNTMHWGIPINYPNTSQIQISPGIPAPQSSARVSENNTEELSPRSPLHYSCLKGKQNEEQVVVGDFRGDFDAMSGGN